MPHQRPQALVKVMLILRFDFHSPHRVSVLPELKGSTQHETESSSRDDLVEINFGEVVGGRLGWCREGHRTPQAFWALRILSSSRTKNQLFSQICRSWDSPVFMRVWHLLANSHPKRDKPPLGTSLGTGRDPNSIACRCLFSGSHKQCWLPGPSRLWKAQTNQGPEERNLTCT